MKNILAVVFLIIASTSHAYLTYDTYKSWEQKANQGDLEASRAIEIYTAGSADTINTIISLNTETVIYLNGEKYVCFPKGVFASGAMVKSAITVTESNSAQMKLMKETYGTEKVPVTSYAIVGLSSMFPCEKP